MAAFMYSSVRHAPASVAGLSFSYDGENRPLSVTHSGKTSEYLYGADGTRLMKKETLAQLSEKVTLYIGGIEVRGPDASETVLAYPHENLRLTFANVNGAPQE